MNIFSTRKCKNQFLIELLMLACNAATIDVAVGACVNTIMIFIGLQGAWLMKHQTTSSALAMNTLIQDKRS
jgi:hypothetical protein